MNYNNSVNIVLVFILQGVMAGFFVSLIFNLWLVIGKSITHSNNQEYLSLSTDGCPENQLNATVGYSTISAELFSDNL